MATKRIKDLTNTAASVASDAYLAIDGTSNGTEKITRDNFRQDTADAFVAAPGTYNLAPLSGGAVEVAKGGTGATTAAGARTNLEVNSVDEDAEATGTKLVGPALYFDGVNDFLEVADDAKLSFTDGTDDLPFTVAGWINATDATSFPVVSKYTSSEWRFQLNVSDKLELLLRESGTDTVYAVSDSALTAYEGQWIHVAATYGGSGPNSASAFTAAADEITLYVNGAVVPSTATNNATYAGMPDSATPVYIGRQGTTYAKGHIKDVKIFNRELTAAEVAQLARGTDLGFADEWGGGTATSGTLTIGKRYRLRDWITGDDFTNVGAGSNADGVEFVATGTTPTTWTNSSVVESIGTLADFRAENYDSDTGKIYDISDNAFVGTSANLPTLTGRAYPVYETGTWTPSVTFGGGSTGITYTTQEGLYTRVGNTVWVSAYVLLSAKGSDTGTALINGLPFTASNTAASSQSFTVGNAANAANLTSAITAYATDNGTTINLVDWGATGSAVLDDTNFAATTALSISGTYQIQ